MISFTSTGFHPHHFNTCLGLYTSISTLPMEAPGPPQLRCSLRAVKLRLINFDRLTHAVRQLRSHAPRSSLVLTWPAPNHFLQTSGLQLSSRQCTLLSYPDSNRFCYHQIHTLLAKINRIRKNCTDVASQQSPDHTLCSLLEPTLHIWHPQAMEQSSLAHLDL